MNLLARLRFWYFMTFQNGRATLLGAAACADALVRAAEELKPYLPQAGEEIASVIGAANATKKQIDAVLSSY